MNRFYKGINKKVILRGFFSYFPYLLQLIRKGRGSKGTGGTNKAEYCYAVWLRHLLYLKESGLKEHPKEIAELGPGDSIGIGIASLITGANSLYALDVIKHSNVNRNLQVFDQLVKLFQQKTPIPSEQIFPMLKPKLKNYAFPKKLLNLDELLAEDRLNKIRDAIINGENDSFKIKYIVPWNNSELLEEGSLDLIYSQAVLEHIPDLEFTYKKMFSFLKKGGFSSHTIDFSSHETHKIWNGHWFYNELLWKIIIHGRSYDINRISHSFHIKYIIESGFEIVNEIIVQDESGIEAVTNNLNYSPSPKDYKIKSSFIQLRKIN